MKNIYFTFVLILSIFTANAQGDYYYYNGNKILLSHNKSNVTIITDMEFDPGSIAEMELFDFEMRIDLASGEPQMFAQLQFQTEPDDETYYQKINFLRQNEHIKHVAYFYNRDNALPISLSNYLYVKLNQQDDLDILHEMSAVNDAFVVKTVPNMPLWYILSVKPNSVMSSLDVANALYETGYYANIDPAFMFNFSNNCTNDPDFGSLWGLNNTSNPNADINACQAWSITEGSGINVAVVDQGIQSNHNDLSGNLNALSFDAQSGTSPSVYNSWYDHGTHVAGTVAAIKDNNLQVVGVAPQSSIMGVSHDLYLSGTFSAELASGISWAWQNNADVITNSWGDQGGAYYNNMHSVILENAITDAMTLGRNGKGSVVLFAAGNWAPTMDYPGSFNDDIVTVGAIESSGMRSGFSGYGTKLDIVAPGSSVLSTVNGNSTGYKSGTSMATPHVAGTIALILSVNPCLTGQEARDILESTAQKSAGYSFNATSGRPNGTWNNEMGYGLADAHAAVLMAQQANTAGIDLYIKDSPADTGAEPNTVTPFMWNSEDIWVRVNNDNQLTHQNPDYSPSNNPNTVYVRVTNKGCVPSDGTEVVNLYWSKAGTSLQWPAHWNGGTFSPGGQLKGDLIGSVTVPVLQPGQEAILDFQWVVPNPADYTAINPEPWHFCLLARVESPNDPMTVPETTDLNFNVTNNNNIGWKNVTVVDDIANIVGEVVMGGTIAIENPFDEPHMYNLEFIKEDMETGNAIYDEATVKIKMDERLYRAFKNAGGSAKQMERGENGTYIVTGNDAVLNLHLEPHETGTLNLTFDFNPEQSSDKSRFVYHVIQRNTETGIVLGGETYVVNKIYNGETTPYNPVANNYIESIAPNPASNDVLVRYHANNTDNAYIMIIGSYGTSDTMYYDIDINSTEIHIPVSDYQNGYYTVALICNGEVKDTKVLLKQ